MPEYILTYARVVILKRRLAADSRATAEAEAMDLEFAGELGLKTVIPEDGSEVDDIEDYDVIWKVERA
jgi:hypothetical protein